MWSVAKVGRLNVTTIESSEVRALSVRINLISKLLNFGNWNEWEYFPSHFLRASEKLYLWFVPICISQIQVISYGCHSRTTLVHL